MFHASGLIGKLFEEDGSGGSSYFFVMCITLYMHKCVHIFGFSFFGFAYVLLAELFTFS
uniref:Uncharacterized protein n=1 Tax=Rhizophora mucronata TaxID=61149 RepID=A0A2P2LFC9_RHIMU